MKAIEAPMKMGTLDVPRAAGLFARLDDGTLVGLALQAVQEFDGVLPMMAAGSGGRFNPAQTTTLLAYCYSRGIFSSEEIETRLPNDRAIAYINSGAKPDWHVLRRFRRDNCLLLLGVLTRLMELAAQHLGVLGLAAVPERWQAGFRAQALDRLRASIQADSFALDQ